MPMNDTTSTGQHRLLGVNIDHVATLRQARLTPYPDLQRAARQCLAAGADLITIHLREDARHIQEEDVRAILAADTGRVNLEISSVTKMVDLACHYRPSDCCVVPENRAELTTEGGLDVAGHVGHLRECVKKLSDAGIEVSFFIEPDCKQIEAALECGARAIELHTGAYANSANPQIELTTIAQATRFAAEQGLRVNAGHGLTLDNLPPLAEIRELAEFNIGHFIVCEAIFLGLDSVITQIKEILHRPF